MFKMDKIIPVSIALSVPSNETSSCFSTIIMLSSVFTSRSIARFHESETTETRFCIFGADRPMNVYNYTVLQKIFW